MLQKVYLEHSKVNQDLKQSGAVDFLRASLFKLHGKIWNFDGKCSSSLERQNMPANERFGLHIINIVLCMHYVCMFGLWSGAKCFGSTTRPMNGDFEA